MTEECSASAFNWVRDSGDVEADNAWNAAHAGMKSITCTATDLNGDVKISCTLTASSATYGSITVDDDLDASHTPAELDANDVFVIEDGYLKVTTSRGNVYALEDSKVKAAGAKMNGSITAETQLFVSQPEDIVEFSYDHNGLRTQKKVTSGSEVTTTEYTLHGKLITHLTRGEDEMHFFYDNESRPAMVDFNGTYYSYVHNLQGDIVGILDNAGNLVVEYAYDAWGKPVVVRTLTTAYEALAKLNPFRYRGYAFDEETELYYLRSRYYNPTSERFLNIDALCGNHGRLLSHNTYSYCQNNPVVALDPDGRSTVLIIVGVTGNVVVIIVAVIGEGNKAPKSSSPKKSIVPSRDYGANHTAHAGEEHKLVASASDSGYIDYAMSKSINDAREKTQAMQSSFLRRVGIDLSMISFLSQNPYIAVISLFVDLLSFIDSEFAYSGDDDQYMGSYTTTVAVYERETAEGTSRYVVRQTYSSNPYLATEPQVFTMDLPLTQEDLMAMCVPSY